MESGDPDTSTTMVDVVPTASSKNTSNEIQSSRGPAIVLRTETFDLDSLVACLQDILSGKRFQHRAVKQLLSSLLETNLGRVAATIEQKLKEETTGYYIVADIDTLGNTFFQPPTTAAEGLWTLLKNTDRFTKTHRKEIKSFGRVMQIRSLPPIITLQLLLCMTSHFDLERLFSNFINRGGSSGYRPDPCWKGSRNIWFFSLKYYYISFQDQDVYPGQKSGPFHKNLPHLRICHGSSSVAWSFSDTEGANTSVALPWRLLILSCNRECVSDRKMQNGVEAFCWGINSELTNVRRRLREVADQIFSVAVPSDDFLFDSEVRESLLFENKDFSNSQTYFWALHSLRLVSECIASIIRSWDLYNKESFLNLLNTGDDGISHTSPSSDGEAAATGAASVPCLDEIQKQMTQLAGMIKDNNAQQEDIRALRDGLFSASSVLETRTTVAQGKNIHLLTLISMVFLPASFATSIFGMQSILPTSTSLTTFAIVMIFICGPAYLVILVLSGGLKEAGEIWKKTAKFWDGCGKVNGKKWLDRANTMMRKKRNKSKDVEKGT